MLLKLLSKLKTQLTLYVASQLFKAVQDIHFPPELITARRVLVILVPEYGAMSGGIYSLFSIANVCRRLKAEHDYEVVVMTCPNLRGLTYCRQRNFRNSEDVYRFEQILFCQSAEEIYLHIPEYATSSFMNLISSKLKEYLRNDRKLYINIMNQNRNLMPEPEDLDPLRRFADELTQSVAHHASYTQKLADEYDLPTLLVPAYTDLSSYEALDFDKKEKLIIYSPDQASHKEKCLSLIRDQLPEYRLLEIRNMSFDEYMNYATRCLFSISFGEGFDGYIAQPIYQGGIGFTVYSDDFFPSTGFRQYDNYFLSKEQMVDEICDKIKKYADDRDKYTDLNKALMEEYKKLYVYSEYIQQITKLLHRKFELQPRGRIPQGGVFKN